MTANDLVDVYKETYVELSKNFNHGEIDVINFAHIKSEEIASKYKLQNGQAMFIVMAAINEFLHDIENI
jgi:hypothetical protein